MIAVLRVWSWLKAHWKWFLFPVAAVLAVFSALAVQSARSSVVLPDDLDDSTKEYLLRLRTADVTRNERVAQLEVEKMDRLRGLAAEQQKELRRLQDAPTEEVVAWFDRL